MTLLVMPECFRVEERFFAEGAHQPHSQVYLARISTNGSMRGWWALLATLNLTYVYMFDAPNWIWRGCMLAGISLSLSKTKGAIEEVDSSACSVGTEASGSLGGRWKMVEEGTQQVFLGGGEDVGRKEGDTAPLRRPYKPSTSEPVTAVSISPTPLPPDDESHFPVGVLLHAVNWPTLADPAPMK